MIAAAASATPDGALRLASSACDLVSDYVTAAGRAVLVKVSVDGALKAESVTLHQRAVHGLAWTKTLAEALRQAEAWGRNLNELNLFGQPEQAVLRLIFAEYLGQILGGIPISQSEIVRPGDLFSSPQAQALGRHQVIADLLDPDLNRDHRALLAGHLLDGGEICERLDGETLDLARDQFRSFTRDRISPFAHQWHLKDALIPDDVIAEMAGLGVFGVSIDPKYGGLGLGKLAMCVVTEELSRGWIAAGSLGTRSEIAGELIAQGGTQDQKDRWLPGIAAGTVLPTAVFTEPGAGSDLAAISTTASRAPDGAWLITGAKTWITHASRSDLMTLLVRTSASTAGHDGLSMLLVPKTRGGERTPFPDEGLEGGEIPVLGYRGMREYALSFDAFRAPSESLLGGVEGQGFHQLMRTFEAARIQTAARAVGVAWNALDLALGYAGERRQFGRSIGGFPRVADKIAMMAVETIAARELTYYAARTKDEGRRCDVEAGMAKLLAARAAWSSADCALQIHGGNGYALEYPISRVLCDARILNIFEGAAEIQAQVIGRGLLSTLSAGNTTS